MNTMALRAADLTVASALGFQAKSAKSGVLRVEIVSDVASFLELEPWWDALLERSAVRTPFMRWDWVNLWRQECDAPFDWVIAVVRNAAGVPQAIAPFVLGHSRCGARKPLRMLTFAGCVGSIESQGMDFLIPDGEEARFAPILCSAFAVLRDRWDIVLLPQMDEESASLPFINEALHDCASGVAMVDRTPSHCFDLASSWPEFEERFSAKWQRNHRRLWRKMTDSFDGRALLGGSDMTAGEAFNDLLQLHASRWTTDESLFLKPEVIGFHRRLTKEWLPKGRLMISTLELDGTPAAAAYAFADFGRLWFYQAGWNESYAALSIGKLSVAWLAQCAMAAGLKEFDFLPGDLSYKREWSNKARHVVDVEAFNPYSGLAFVFRLVRGIKRWFHSAKRFVCSDVKGARP